MKCYSLTLGMFFALSSSLLEAREHGTEEPVEVGPSLVVNALRAEELLKEHEKEGGELSKGGVRPRTNSTVQPGLLPIPVRRGSNAGEAPVSTGKKYGDEADRDGFERKREGGDFELEAGDAEMSEDFLPADIIREIEGLVDFKLAEVPVLELAQALGVNREELRDLPELDATEEEVVQIRRNSRITPDSVKEAIGEAADLFPAGPDRAELDSLQVNVSQKMVSRLGRSWSSTMKSLRGITKYLKANNLKMSVISKLNKTYFVMKKAGKVLTVLSAPVFFPATLIIDAYRGGLSLMGIGVIPEMLAARALGYYPKRGSFIQNFVETYNQRGNYFIDAALGLRRWDKTEGSLLGAYRGLFKAALRDLKGKRK